MLTIIRGLPGSGKSTLAHRLAAVTPNSIVCEADQYFMVDGQYCFDPRKLAAAHDDCFERVCAALNRGMHVFVSNTFTQRWEYQRYLDANERLGYTAPEIPSLQVIELHGSFGSVHGVPADTVRWMRERWEPHR